MESPSVVAKEPRKHSLKFKKIWMTSLVIVAALAILGGTFLVLKVVYADNTFCQPTDGYQLITSRMATDASGNTVFILRGLVSTGEGSPGGKSITIPPCGSNDPVVQVKNNMIINLDGQQYILAAGSIGQDVQSNPTPGLQP